MAGKYTRHPTDWPDELTQRRRMNLPKRASPIRRDEKIFGPPRPPRRPKCDSAKTIKFVPVPRVTLERLPSLKTVAPKVVPPPVPLPAPATLLQAPTMPCQWPFGVVRTPEFHFCEVRSEPGRPYCTAHMNKAYLTRAQYHAQRDAQQKKHQRLQREAQRAAAEAA